MYGKFTTDLSLGIGKLLPTKKGTDKKRNCTGKFNLNEKKKKTCSDGRDCVLSKNTNNNDINTNSIMKKL